MNVIKWCICGQRATEMHHIVFRSKQPALVHCKSNLVPLCRKCHYSIHHGNRPEGHKLDQKLKLEFQNKLEILWDKQYLTREEINEILQINEKALNRLLKTVQKSKDKYIREDIIRTCMGGRTILNEPTTDNKQNE